ncbi:MAG: APC family permease [Eggerthellaceae bacterium]|jgi:APA family basic amino acid/polyamine antiporter
MGEVVKNGVSPGAAQSNNGQAKEGKLAKEITSIGFFGLGLSAIFGSSWLLTSGAWLARAGGPVNAMLAFALCFLVELPLILAYYEATPMMPLAGGEMVYSYLNLGSFWGFLIGWFTVLANIILCIWEALAISRCLSVLIPQISTDGVLYEFLGYQVTIYTVLIGLALILICGYFAYRGAKSESYFGLVITLTVNAIALICVIVGVFYFDPANLQPLQTKDTATGTLGLLAMLPFSVAGWDGLTKGAAEAAPTVPHKRIGGIVVLCVGIAVIMYMITTFIPSALVPWQELTEQTAPFQYAMAKIGFPILGAALILAATIGCIGVYNVVLFAGARLLYQMGDIGLVPKKFATLHPKYKSPTFSIYLISAISIVVLFLGQGMFIPLIDVAAITYIIYWGATLLSVYVGRKKYPDVRRPAKYPGGKPLMVIGMVIALILACLILIPGNPASLQWPVEYILFGALIVVGIILYLLRDKSVPKGASVQRLWDEINANLDYREQYVKEHGLQQD